MEISLSSVPPWFPDQPYLSTPLLAAILRSHGHSVRQFDLNLQFYECFLDPAFLSGLLEKPIDSAQFNSPEMFRLWEARSEIVNALPEAISIIKTDEFYSRSRLLEAIETIELGLRLASLAYPKVKLGFGKCEYAFDSFTPSVVALFIVDRAQNPFYDFFLNHHISQIQSAEPHLYGISITTHEQLIPALTLCHILRERFPATRIVLGGSFLSRISEAITNCADLWGMIDFLVCGDGEEAIWLLPRAIGGEIKYSEVPNLWYHSETGAATFSFEKRADIHSLPCPDFDDLPLDRYFSPELTLPVEMSKGCYWGRCEFCEVTDLGYTSKGGDALAVELETLHRRYGARSFTICDSASPPAHLVQMSQTLQDRGLHVFWRAMVRTEKYLTPEKASLLYSAGCRMLMVGLESGSDAVLGSMNKGSNSKTAEVVLRNLSDAGIWIHAYFLFGFFGETNEDVEATLRFVRANANHLDSIGVNLFILAKGSPAYRKISVSRNDVETLPQRPLQVYQPHFSSPMPSPIEDSELRGRISEGLKSMAGQREAAAIHLNWLFACACKLTSKTTKGNDASHELLSVQ